MYNYNNMELQEYHGARLNSMALAVEQLNDSLHGAI